MSFQTGTTSSPSDLLDKVVQFASATAGWTKIRDAATGDTTEATLRDTSAAESPYFHFLSNNSVNSGHISFQMSTADSGAAANFYAHTGSPDTSGTDSQFSVVGQKNSLADQGFSGTSVAYWIFAAATLSDGRYCHVVVEGATGVFWHFGFGTIAKAGAFTGGQYTVGLNVVDTNTADDYWPWEFRQEVPDACNWARCDNFFTGTSVTTDSGASRYYRGIGAAHNRGTTINLWGPFYQGGLNAFNQRTPFGPIIMQMYDSTGPIAQTTQMKILGHTPDWRLCSMDGLNAGDIITIGSDEWYIFPVHQKRTTGTASTTDAYTFFYDAGGPPHTFSNLAGFAYKKVP